MTANVRKVMSRGMVVGVLLLTGCASVPLASMWQLSGIDESNFLQLDPRQLRVRGTIEEAVGADLVKAVDLSMVLNTDEGTVPLKLPLAALYRQQVAAQTGLFGDTPAMESTTLALTPEGVADFEKVQRLLSKQAIRGGRFSAGFDLKRENMRRPVSRVTVSVAIRLGEDDDFIPLIEKHVIDFAAIAKQTQ